MEEHIKLFKTNGLIHKLLKCEEDIALYEQINPSTNNVLGFEVHILKRQPVVEKTINGYSFMTKNIRTRSNEEFGTYAWSFQRFKGANDKYHLELEKVRERLDATASRAN